ncbi:hypothetical protein HDU76_004730 [Blyttiomyces sp. JEL0837]|nr:hypothetical protein HDU76_004730 [Blyttiomyces sp. JEL0837]
MAKERGKFVQQLVALDSGPLGDGCKEITAPIHTALQKYNEQFGVFDKLLKETVIHRLQECRGHLIKKTKTLRTAIDTVTHQILQIRTKTLDSITTHEKARYKKVSGGSSHDHKSPMDPWLTERVLNTRLSKMVAEENEFQKQVTGLVQEYLEWEEGTVVKEVVKAFEEVWGGRKAMWESWMTQLEFIKIHLSSMPPHALFKSYDTHHNITTSPSLTTLRNLTDFPYKAQDIKILKESILYRPAFWNFKAGGVTGGVVVVRRGLSLSKKLGSGASSGSGIDHQGYNQSGQDLKNHDDQDEGELEIDDDEILNGDQDHVQRPPPPSRSNTIQSTTSTSNQSQHHQSTPHWPSSWYWKPALYVLTDSGYLHCFQKPHGKIAGDHRRHVRASAKKNLPIPASQSIIQREESEVPIYQSLEKPVTFYSIFLGRPGRVFVEIGDGREVTGESGNAGKSGVRVGEFVFSVVVLDSKKLEGSGFRRYEIRAGSEEEMIEWVAVLKAKIEAYIPNGPPAPLYRTPEELQDRLQITLEQSRATISSSQQQEKQQQKNPQSQYLSTTTLTSSQTQSSADLFVNNNSNSLSRRSTSNSNLLKRKPVQQQQQQSQSQSLDQDIDVVINHGSNVDITSLSSFKPSLPSGTGSIGRGGSLGKLEWHAPTRPPPPVPNAGGGGGASVSRRATEATL